MRDAAETAKRYGVFKLAWELFKWGLAVKYGIDTKAPWREKKFKGEDPKLFIYHLASNNDRVESTYDRRLLTLNGILDVHSVYADDGTVILDLITHDRA